MQLVKIHHLKEIERTDASKSIIQREKHNRITKAPTKGGVTC